jgi:hypothetical protein
MEFREAYNEYLKYTPNIQYNSSFELIDELSNKLKNGENITISRFNDGEWAFMFNHISYINARLTKLHTSADAKLCLSYTARLLNKILNNEPDYFVSIDSRSRTELPFKKWVDANIYKFKNVIGGGVFNIWSLYTGFDDLFNIFTYRDVLIVGPNYLKRLPIDADYITFDSVTAIYDTQKNVCNIIRYLDNNYKKNMIIIYSCSFIANVAIDEIYKIYGNNITQLDMGASLNPFVGISNRFWHDLMIAKIKNKK